MRKFFGQIGIVSVIGWGITLATLVTGSMWAKISSTDASVDKVKEVQTSVLQRVSTVEADSKTLKDDIKEIKSDVKLLLKQSK